MKTIHYLLFAPILCLFACAKDPAGKDPVPPDPVDTLQHVIDLEKVSVLRDGKIWMPGGMAQTYPSVAMHFSIISTQIVYPGVVESFNLADIPLKTGKYRLERGVGTPLGNFIPQITIGWILDGDQLLGSLNADTTDMDNFVELLQYDSLKQTVEGRFQIHLINYKSSTNGSIYPLPDSMRLTDGKFYLKLN